ncbi:hypothetical protein [Saccharospirillum sp.]|uniref:hypothetical protein n=1 Tax=Saccharospirillum sp. TaxID=2033801 RepID=UPI0034A02439
MTTVQMTSHLYRYFPQLENQTVKVPAGPVSEVLRAVNEIAPGFTDYVLDDQGGLRRHVHLAINNTLVVDRKTLSDHALDGGTVYIFQALSGG